MAAIEEDRDAVRAEIRVLRSQRLAYKQELSETRHALIRFEAHDRSLEDADDTATEHIMRAQALKVRVRADTLEDAGSSS
ncbi:hypothetical protein Tco_1081629 [Tanacetum coccineum]|uniref:Uncharacterized protein n=1 Tax=Tanacetum coccineum TaxID=301880 RepID=A0ABQ5HY91_9ASTR